MIKNVNISFIVFPIIKHVKRLNYWKRPYCTGWLDCFCLTTTHVLKDILAVFHKWGFLNCLCSRNKLQSPMVLLGCGDWYKFRIPNFVSWCVILTICCTGYMAFSTSTLYHAFNYLSMLVLKLNHVRNRCHLYRKSAWFVSIRSIR